MRRTCLLKGTSNIQPKHTVTYNIESSARIDSLDFFYYSGDISDELDVSLKTMMKFLHSICSIDI